MNVVVVILTVGLLVIALTDRFARHSGVAAPIVLLLLGAATAMLPGMPDISVDPEVILVLVLPPLLFASAQSMPVMEFRRNLGPISGLSCLLVAVTACVVGLCLHRMNPGMAVAAAIALGAIVSPTDAVATSIVREAGVARRVVTVLDGEGLINDATALVVLTSAVAATTGTVTGWQVAGSFIRAVVVALLVGWVVGRGMMWLRARSSAATPDSLLSLATPYLAFLPAEHLGGSGLVAAVIAGLVTGHTSTLRLSPLQRQASEQMWRTLMLVLEASVFLLMGLELSSVVHRLSGDEWTWQQALLTAATALATVMVIRTAVVSVLLVWGASHSRRRAARRSRLEAMATASDEQISARVGRDDPRRATWYRRLAARAMADIDYYTEEPLGPREGVVLVWAGMRGAVTLAAAQTLPLELAHRDFMVLVAFVVAAASLLLQGATLTRVVSLVRPAPAPEHSPAEHARVAELMHDAASQVTVPPELTALLARAEARRDDPTGGDVTKLEASDSGSAQAPAVMLVWRLMSADRGTRSSQRRLRAQVLARDYAVTMIEAQRRALVAARDSGRFDPDELAEALATLDTDQISVESHRLTRHRSPAGPDTVG